ncbi:hypothetical protein F4556_006385 [Kitasatospora gansuensis]|uniref:Uncharacterized protein n=1 Tax=Kitasatospora gansuensis TaxID=258050 RepID=A0A7W7WLA6_9ACTN|nr:hypothetical protein [Kitasatospora gansuensis]
MLDNAGLMPLSPLEMERFDEWAGHRRQRQGRPDSPASHLSIMIVPYSPGHPGQAETVRRQETA